MIAISSMVFATSCSNEDFDSPVTEGESLVNFAVEVPNGLNSRTYGDGLTAENLQYSVYEITEGNWTYRPQLNGTATFTSLRTQVPIRLVNGKSYKIVFWASAEGAPYNFDAEAKTVTVDYDSAATNDEKLDAFYAVESVTVTESSSKTVELHRPFAQLNIGTADLAAYHDAGYSVGNTSVTVSAVYDTFDFVSENVSGIAHPQEFNDGARSTTETYPVSGYNYLAMNYLLVSKDKQTVDVTLNYGGAVNPTYANVPVQRNYRTNIYGNLLTSQEDFNVVIVPDFEEPDYGVSVWDGTTSELPVADANGVHHITSAAQFVGMMNNSGHSACNAYKNVVLDCDIDLGGNTINGFGDGSGYFYGTFDGQGHTISNFIINHTTFNAVGTGLFNHCGIYDNAVTGILKNLNVKNASVTGPKNVGVLVGQAYNGFVIENCHVSSSTVIATEKRPGGLVGQIQHSLVKNCSVEDTNIYTASDGTDNENTDCSIVGYTNPATPASTVDSDCTATNVNVYRNATAINTAAEFAAITDPDNITNRTINIHLLSDIDLTGVPFSTIYFNNDNVSVYGNGHSITGFTKPLFNFYGCGVNIEKLTAKNVTISANAGQLGCGVIAEQTQWCNLTMTDCHVESSNIYSEVDTRYGLLVGYVIGGADITGCTVKSCNVDVAAGAVGGIIGHEGRESGYNNWAKVNNCTVENAELKTSDGGDWRVGYIIGTVAGANTEINGCSVEGTNRIEQTGKTAPEHSNLYGRISGGSLTINGTPQ